MVPKGFQQYKEQAVNTMTPEELLQLLYSEALKRMTQAELALDKENYPVFEASLDRAIDILNYLDDTLDRRFEISAQLTRLYDYFTYELGRAKIGRRKEPILEVHSRVKELQDTFRDAQAIAAAGPSAREKQAAGETVAEE